MSVRLRAAGVRRDRLPAAAGSRRFALADYDDNVAFVERLPAYLADVIRDLEARVRVVDNTETTARKVGRRLSARARGGRARRDGAGLGPAWMLALDDLIGADTDWVMGQPDDLNQLLKAASAADPGVRIQFRDPIAAHGASAIPQLRRWLADDRLSAFAVRTLEKIAVESSNRRAALEPLRSLNSRAVSEWTSRDVADAMAKDPGKGPSSRRSQRAC